MIVMAIVGGAVLTPIMGLISVKSGSIAMAYTVPLVAYILIALYAFSDARLMSSAHQPAA
jgi:FHS family L-fucose permease-like MFS transporter